MCENAYLSIKNPKASRARLRALEHESEIGFMNQLFDRKGDKTTLACSREWAVPQNSISMFLGVQPQSFFKTLQSIGKTTWQDSGFAERFLFSSIKPYR